MVVTSGIERAIQYFHAFQGLPGRAQEPVPGHRRVLGRARVRRRQGQRGVAQRLPEQGHRRQDPGRPVPLPDLRRQVPDRLRRAAAAHDVRGQGAVGHQGGADAVAPEPRAPAEARLLRARLPEQQRGHHLRLPGLLPHHAAGRRDRPEQAARPEGALDAAQVYAPEQVQQFVALFPRPAPSATSSTRSSTPAWPSTRTLDEDQQVDFKGKAKVFCRTYDFLASVMPAHARGLGEAVDLPEPADAQAAGAEGRGPGQGHPRSHRHGQLPRREEGG
jgi:hypothetical protein